MFEFSLLKSLFFELDKYEMDGVEETKKGNSTFRRIEINYESVPNVTSITAEERILPMVDRYYLYINDEKSAADVKEGDTKQAIYEFYKDHFPEYLVEDLPDILGEINILECFQVYKMPDYRPKHAFPGLVFLDDIRSGKARPDERIATFPGLELIKKDDGKPAISEYEGYTAFSEDVEEAREEAKNKLEMMKKQFASELEGLNIPEKG